ncbi:MAG: YihY/virulence factor BrkB family protein [Thermoleophilaceae bacterium]|nr:YihY/virulence factor BrkB family protein [Thermoleophilaceae bacterium]
MEASSAGSRPADASAPDTPTDLTKRSWKGVLVRTVKEFQDDNLTDWAAALTYYAILALFPGILVFVALLGVLGQFPDTFNALLEIARQVAPPSAVDSIAGPIESVIKQKQAAGALLGVGLLSALWAASGYIGAFMRAANVIYEVKEGRPFWKLRPLQILVTIVMVLLLAVVAIGIVITGPLAEAVGNVIGLGDLAVTAWSYGKWPVMLIVIMGMFAALYWVAPNVKHPHFRWVSPGGIVAVLLWILASVAFGLYVANFSSYDKTYGSLGGAITFLVWLWVTNIALLLGAEFDAELERARELEAGLPAEHELQLPPRDAAKT